MIKLAFRHNSKDWSYTTHITKEWKHNRVSGPPSTTVQKKKNTVTQNYTQHESDPKN